MGNLILCKGQVAAMPFFLEDLSLNVYSLEEISYFLKENVDLAEQEFVKEEFTEWVRIELKMEELAEKLDFCRKKQNVIQFMQLLLSANNYLLSEEIEQISKELTAYQNKSEIECKKIRADRLLQKQSFAIAVQEYRKILDEKEVRKEDPMLQGSIWNNMGTAYARMFLFADAMKCYEKAYRFQLHVEIGREYWFACYFAYGEEETARQMTQQNMSLEEQQQFFEMAHQFESAADKALEGQEREEQDLTGKVAHWREMYCKRCVF